MPLHGGKFNINPGQSKMAEPAPDPTQADPGAQEGPPSHIEVHGKGQGPFHTLAHKGDGAEPERQDHGSLEDAEQAVDVHCTSDDYNDIGEDTDAEY